MEPSSVRTRYNSEEVNYLEYHGIAISKLLLRVYFATSSMELSFRPNRVLHGFNLTKNGLTAVL